VQRSKYRGRKRGQKKRNQDQEIQRKQDKGREIEEPNKLAKKRKIEEIIEIYKEGKSRLFN